MSVCCAVPQVLRLDNEALELLKHGYVRVFYLAFYCKNCGSCRAAVAVPSKRIDCLICGRRCRCHQIGVGFTKRPLPQHEVLSPPIRLACVKKLDVTYPEPFRVLV